MDNKFIKLDSIETMKPMELGSARDDQENSSFPKREKKCY